MKSLLNVQSIKHLKEGGILHGRAQILSLRALENIPGMWVCGTDYMVKELIGGTIPDGLSHLIEANEGVLLVDIEIKQNEWIKLCIDLDGDLGELSLGFRRPIFLHTNTPIKVSSLKIREVIALPLQAEIERIIEVSIRKCSHHFHQYLDGSFKLSKNHDT